MIHLRPPLETSPLLPDDRNPAETLEKIATSLRRPNLLIDEHLQVIEKNWRWRVQTFSRQITNPCSSTDSLKSFRIPLVANNVLGFCQSHSTKIAKTPELWTKVFHEILTPLEYRSQKKYGNEMASVMDRWVRLVPQIARPANKTAFPDSPGLTMCLQWIARALMNPKRYELQSCLKDQISLKDLKTHETLAIKLPFSVDIVYENNRLVHCILISQHACEQGSFSSPPICWDVLLGQSLVLKSREIEETARPIIEYIAKQRFPEAVPILVLDMPWRIYEKDCGHDLWHILTQCRITDEQKLECAKQLLQMLANFHTRTYLIDNQTFPAFHGDIKPSNILHNDGLVFTDFGSTSLALVSGTIDYMSPQTIQLLEALRQKTNHTDDWILFNEYRQAHDVWSMGITLFQVLKDRYVKLPLLFTKAELACIEQKDLDAKLKKEKPSCLSEALEPVWLCIEHMLRVDPKERISAKEAYELLSQPAAQQIDV